MINDKYYDFSIVIKNRKTDIVESHGKSFFTLLLDKDVMPDYHKVILANGICPALLPMHFINSSKGLQAHYEYSGYVQLKDIYGRWRMDGKNIAIESIEMIFSVISGILSIENFLFRTKGYRLHADSIFVRPDRKEIKLAFIPEKESAEQLSSRLAMLIEDTAKIAEDEQWNIYSSEIQNKILSGEDSLSIIEKKLHQVGERITYCDWPEKRALRKEVPGV